MQLGVSTLVSALVACVAPDGTSAETMRFSASVVLITGGDAGTLRRVCDPIWGEAARLADCNVAFHEEIKLRVLPELPDGYFALSCVNLALIEILPPDLMVFGRLLRTEGGVGGAESQFAERRSPTVHWDPHSKGDCHIVQIENRSQTTRLIAGH